MRPRARAALQERGVHLCQAAFTPPHPAGLSPGPPRSPPRREAPSPPWPLDESDGPVGSIGPSSPPAEVEPSGAAQLRDDGVYANSGVAAVSFKPPVDSVVAFVMSIVGCLLLAFSRFAKHGAIGRSSCLGTPAAISCCRRQEQAHEAALADSKPEQAGFAAASQTSAGADSPALRHQLPKGKEGAGIATDTQPEASAHVDLEGRSEPCSDPTPSGQLSGSLPTSSAAFAGQVESDDKHRLCSDTIRSAVPDSSESCRWQVEVLSPTEVPMSHAPTPGKGFTTMYVLDLPNHGSADLGRGLLQVPDRKVSRRQLRVEICDGAVQVRRIGPSCSCLQLPSGRLELLHSDEEVRWTADETLLWLICESEGELRAAHAVCDGYALKHALRLVHCVGRTVPATSTWPPPAWSDAEGDDEDDEAPPPARVVRARGRAALGRAAHTPAVRISPSSRRKRAQHALLVEDQEDLAAVEPLASEALAASKTEAVEMLDAAVGAAAGWSALCEAPRRNRAHTRRGRRAGQPSSAIPVPALGAVRTEAHEHGSLLRPQLPAQSPLHMWAAGFAVTIACTLSSFLFALDTKSTRIFAAPRRNSEHRKSARLELELRHLFPTEAARQLESRAYCALHGLSIYLSSLFVVAASTALVSSCIPLAQKSSARPFAAGLSVVRQASDEGSRESARISEDAPSHADRQGSGSATIDAAGFGMARTGNLRPALSPRGSTEHPAPSLQSTRLLRRLAAAAFAVGALLALRWGSQQHFLVYCPVTASHLPAEYVTDCRLRVLPNVGSAAPPPAGSGQTAAPGGPPTSTTPDAPHDTVHPPPSPSSVVHAEEGSSHSAGNGVALPSIPPALEVLPVEPSTAPKVSGVPGGHVAAARPILVNSSSDGERVVASFFAIGDWGYDPEIHQFRCGAGTRRHCVVRAGCQRALAAAMRAEAKKRGNVAFVLNVGDSFYPGGVHGTTDPQWTEKWSDVYQGLPPMPWYSVYGNHDLEAVDWRCGCQDDASACHQVQKHGSAHGNVSWYMPSTSYYSQPIAGVPLEVVGLDLNAADTSRICPWIALAQRCPAWRCGQVLAQRESDAARLLQERVRANQGKNLLVISHYPTDYLRGRQPSGIDMLKLLRSADTRITYFGGHRHATAGHNSGHAGTESIRPNDNWLVGGGGGWACDGQQGFVAGEVLSTGEVTRLQAVMMHDRECCATKDV